MAHSTSNGPIQAAYGCMAHGSLNQPVLGFGHQYTTQILVLMKKNTIFGQNLPIDRGFPILN